MVTFGSEDEYLLVDPAIGLPKFISTQVSRVLQTSVEVHDGDIQHELLACQLETSTPHATRPERRSTPSWPFASNWPKRPTNHWPAPGVPELPRRWKRHRQRLRTISYRRWPLQSVPPVFKDAADYAARVQHLMDTGVIIDQGVITWVARLSENYPTLEVRACDAQLEARDSVLLAVLIRALVTTALNDPLRLDFLPAGSAHTGSAHAGSTHAGSAQARLQLTTEIIDAALWQAARHGLTGDLVHPATGRLAPAANVTAALLDLLTPALDEAGDCGCTVDGLARFVERGARSTRPRRAREQGGLRALLDLFSGSLTAR